MRSTLFAKTKTIFTEIIQICLEIIACCPSNIQWIIPSLLYQTRFLHIKQPLKIIFGVIFKKKKINKILIFEHTQFGWSFLSLLS